MPCFLIDMFSWLHTGRNTSGNALETVVMVLLLHLHFWRHCIVHSFCIYLERPSQKKIRQLLQRCFLLLATQHSNHYHFCLSRCNAFWHSLIYLNLSVQVKPSVSVCISTTSCLLILIFLIHQHCSNKRQNHGQKISKEATCLLRPRWGSWIFEPGGCSWPQQCCRNRRACHKEIQGCNQSNSSRKRLSASHRLHCRLTTSQLWRSKEQLSTSFSPNRSRKRPSASHRPWCKLAVLQPQCSRKQKLVTLV